MTSAITNRIGKKMQMAVAGAVLAGSLLAATPLVADAHAPDRAATCLSDWNHDGFVRMDDVTMVAEFWLGLYGQSFEVAVSIEGVEVPEGTVQIQNVLVAAREVAEDYWTDCPSA